MKQIPFPHQFCIFNLPPNIHSALPTPGAELLGSLAESFVDPFATASAHATSRLLPSLGTQTGACTRPRQTPTKASIQPTAYSSSIRDTLASPCSLTSITSKVSQHRITLRRRIEQVPGRIPWVQGTSALPQTTTGTNAAIEISDSPRPPPSQSTTPLASPIAVRPA
jgi:hypothetical protein